MANKNDVLIIDNEFKRLIGMAEAMEQRKPMEAEPLLAKLDIALTVSEGKAPDNLVRMGSLVVYEMGGLQKEVSIVFPVEADIDAGRISVSSPLGVAMIGQRSGQDVVLQARDGKKSSLKIVKVKAPDGV